VAILTGLVPSFVAGILVQLTLATRPVGGRGALVAPVVLVAVALGVSACHGLRRPAWCVAAAAVPVTIYLVEHPFHVHGHPGLLPLVGLVPTGVILSGPLLALHSPRFPVRAGVAAGLAAGMAVGPVVLGGFFAAGPERSALVVSEVAGGIVLVSAGIASLLPWQSTVDDSRNGPGPWVPVAVGVALAVAQYGLIAAGVLVVGGDDPVDRAAPHVALVLVSSLALGIAVTAALGVLAYRSGGPAGARWTVALAALAYPAVDMFGPFLAAHDIALGVPAEADAGRVAAGRGAHPGRARPAYPAVVSSGGCADRPLRTVRRDRRPSRHTVVRTQRSICRGLDRRSFRRWFRRSRMVCRRSDP
jgi:hypothetical protein